MGELVPIVMFGGFFAMIAAIVVIPRWLKTREREAIQATLRAAIERGQTLPPEIVDAMSTDTKPKPSAARDMRTGVIWIGVALGLIGFAYAIGYMDEDAAQAFYPLLGIAAFPGFVGLAFLVLGLMNRSKGRD